MKRLPDLPGLAAVFAAVAAVVLIGVAPGPLAGGDDAKDQKYVVRIIGSDGGGAYLGVQVVEDTERREGGARIEEVVEGSPANKAGLQKGDIIVGFGGEPIHGPVRLTERIRSRAPGDQVEVTIVRDGKRRTVAVELGERAELWERWSSSDEGDYSFYVMPDDGWAKKMGERAEEWAQEFHHWQEEHGKEMVERHRERAEEHAARARELAERYAERYREYGERFGDRNWSGMIFAMPGERPKLGVHLVETTPELRAHLGGSAEAGVLVSKVIPGTPAERAGVRVGDLILSVDGESVSSAAQLIAALSDKGGKTIELEIVREGTPRKIRADIEEVESDGGSGPRAFALPAPASPAEVELVVALADPASAPLALLPEGRAVLAPVAPLPGDAPVLAPVPPAPMLKVRPSLAPRPAVPLPPAPPAEPCREVRREDRPEEPAAAPGLVRTA